VTQAGLNVIEADAFVEQVVGEGVAQGMGVYAFFNTCLLAKSLEHVPHVDSLQGFSVVLLGDPAEDWRVAFAVDADLSPLLDPLVEMHLGLGIESNHPHFVSLANNAQSAFLWVVVAGASTQGLADSEATAIEDNDQNLVSQTAYAAIALGQKCHDFVLGIDLGVELPAFGGFSGFLRAVSHNSITFVQK
jgi:hypothetical protein